LFVCALGVESPVPTRDFVVDTSDRSEVVSFYHAVYMASEGYQHRIAWTGNYGSTAAGAEGSVSQVFSDDVERRVNYYRAMCGLPAGARVNSGAAVRISAEDIHQPPGSTTKMAASQRSALMIARTYPSSAGLSHNPASSCVAWTTAAWNANKYGNLSLGFFGPGAVDAYAKEDVMGISSWNLDAGHRRWLLFQGATDFATGDTPGVFAAGSIRPPTNSMYVVPRAGELDPEAPVFVSYPPKGYFPARLNTPFWSLSYPDADFSAATVSMTGAGGVPVPVSVASRRSGFGDNSIVWQVPAATAAKQVGADTTWNVTVANIQGAGVPTQQSWSVTLIDPERLNEAPVVSGAANPPISGAVYTVSPVAGAEAMEVGLNLRKPATWTEGAEDGVTSRMIDRTSGTYAFRAVNTGYVKTGGKAFRLTFPTRYDPFINGVPEQIMELDRDLVPGAGGKLNFQYRRGLMTGASKLAVETSADGGLTWTLAGSHFSGLGGAGDAAFQIASVPLPEGPLRVRFRYHLSDPSSALYAHEDYPSQPTGVFIDDITTSGCTWLEPTATLGSPGMSSFGFNSTNAGTPLVGGQEWWFRARAVLGGKAFPWGPAKVVSPSGPLQLSGPAEPPLSGATYSFVPEPGASSYRLEVARLGAADWLEGAEISPAPQVLADISGAYALSSDLKGRRKSGAFAFRLALSTAADEADSFTIDRQIVPGPGSVLEFWTRRGSMSKTNALHVEVSTDGGATWTSAWSLPGLQKAEKKVLLRSVSLAPWADVPIRVRFAIRKAGGGLNLKWNAKSSGVWIDDIAVTNSTTLISSHETTVPGLALTVRLDAASAGQELVDGSTMRMRMRGVSGDAPGEWGPALTAMPSALASEPALPEGFGEWAEANHPGLGLSFEGDHDADGLTDGIEYAFSLDPVRAQAAPDMVTKEAERMSISRNLPEERTGIRYGAEWTDDLGTWSDEDVQIEIEGGKITASAPKGSGTRFMRWRIEEE
jgi:hypothetical protein